MTRLSSSSPSSVSASSVPESSQSPKLSSDRRGKKNSSSSSSSSSSSLSQTKNFALEGWRGGDVLVGVGVDCLSKDGLSSESEYAQLAELDSASVVALSITVSRSRFKLVLERWARSRPCSLADRTDDFNRDPVSTIVLCDEGVGVDVEIVDGVDTTGDERVMSVGRCSSRSRGCGGALNECQ